MKNTISAIFLVLFISVYAQKTYEVNGFSEQYLGKLTIEKGYEDQVFKKGNISILNAKTNETLISIDSDELTFELSDDGNVITNVTELPYGEQSIIISEDFNFDGKKDLAIMDGQFSCYHGPSFQIYLESKDGLDHSPEFTRLAQDYCGMFNILSESKKISTMTKSGCCWHQFSIFSVEYKIPVEEKVVEEKLNANGIIWDYVEQNRIGNQMVESNYSMLSTEADVILVYGMKFKNGKTLQIYRAFAFEDYLFYVLTDQEEKIELFYSDQFTYDTNKNLLTFTNNDVTYNIYEGGIKIETSPKNIDWKATQIDKETSLKSLTSLKLKNLIIN